MKQTQSVYTDGYHGYSGRHVFIVNVWDYAKIQPLVWLMSNITYPGKLTQTANTYNEDLVSFIKDRVLSPMLSSK